MTVAASEEIIELPAELTGQLQWLVNTSFMIPAAARKALELARNPECDVDEFLDVVKRDPKLAADILTMANSTGFSAAHRILDLHSAVVRLGFRQCRNLIVTAAFASLMTRITATQQAVRNAIWRQSFATATICQLLNRRTGLGFQGEEFSAGLIHDFGRLALVTLYPALSTATGISGSLSPEEIREQERRMCGADHCAVGAWAVQVNEMPSILVDAVRYHHDPAACGAQHRILCCLVAAGERLARHLTSGSPSGDSVVEEGFLAALRSVSPGEKLAEALNAGIADPILEEAHNLLSADPLAMYSGRAPVRLAEGTPPVAQLPAD